MTLRLPIRESFAPFFVVALGTVMALTGMYEVYFGNTYISVERGWSAFISGTILLTGGLVTIALGFAIRAIMDLKTALRSSFAGSVEAEIAPAYSERDFVDPTPTFDRVSPPLPEASDGLAAALTSQPVPALLRTEPDLVLPAEAGHGSNMMLHDHNAPVAPGHPAALPLEPVYASGAHIEGGGHAARSHVELAPARGEPTAEDRLDRMFADPSRKLQPVDGHASLTSEEPVHLAPAAPVPSDVEHELPEDDGFTAQETRPHQVPDRASTTAQNAVSHDEEAPPTAPTSPVIGRYDAEGTSYVMYADGSIEAQSEAGVYRFASMAELKAFIEG